MSPEPEPPPLPSPALSAPPYAELFSEAMEAYFDQDFARARAGLERCCKMRPTDPRARHNLERIEALEPEPR